MNTKDVEKLLYQLKTVGPSEFLDRNVAKSLGIAKEHPEGGKAGRWDTSEIWRSLLSIKPLRFAGAAALLMGAFLVYNALDVSPSSSNIAWSQVMQNLEYQIQTNDSIHLFIKDQKPIFGINFGDFIKTEEVWVQRPCFMRAEENWQIVKDPGYVRGIPTTTIYNEEGEYSLNHLTKYWGFLDGDLLNYKHKETYRQLRQKQIDRYLMAKYYALYEEPNGTYHSSPGHVVGQTELEGEGVTLYDFNEYKETTYRCWLRDRDQRLLRMEVYEEEQDKPVRTYQIDYDAVPQKTLFIPAIPADYQNGQVLGYEDQPTVIHPGVAAVTLDENTLRFYRLPSDKWQNQHEASEADLAERAPAIEIRVEQPDDLFVKHTPPDGSKQEHNTWHAVGFGYVGELHYGVLVPDQESKSSQRLDIMLSSEYAEQGPIILAFIYYRTDYGYCKAAFDADGDGQMDVWCQIPSEETVLKWRETVLKGQ